MKLTAALDVVQLIFLNQDASPLELRGAILLLLQTIEVIGAELVKLDPELRKTVN